MKKKILIAAVSVVLLAVLVVAFVRPWEDSLPHVLADASVVCSSETVFKLNPGFCTECASKEWPGAVERAKSCSTRPEARDCMKDAADRYEASVMYCVGHSMRDVLKLFGK